MDFSKAIDIAASGLRAQGGRMRIISENIANADSTSTRPDGDPYRRRIPTFRSEMDKALEAKVVTLGRVASDQGQFKMKYEPNHPAANGAGYVKYPNVNTTVEMTDMKEAQRSYEANLNVISATRRMIARTLDLLKS